MNKNEIDSAKTGLAAANTTNGTMAKAFAKMEHYISKVPKPVQGALLLGGAVVAFWEFGMSDQLKAGLKKEAEEQFTQISGKVKNMFDNSPDDGQADA